MKNKQKKHPGENVQQSSSIFKSLSKIFVTVAGAGLAISAIYGFFRAVGVKETLDKISVIVFAVSVSVYYSYDIKDKLSKWNL